MYKLLLYAYIASAFWFNKEHQKQSDKCIINGYKTAGIFINKFILKTETMEKIDYIFLICHQQKHQLFLVAERPDVQKCEISPQDYCKIFLS